jgi:hypothetical protein
MAPEDFVDDVYLVYLSLAACGLETWPDVLMVNLQQLHVSQNKLSTVSMQRLALLTNLRVLNLSGNPLVGFVQGSYNLTMKMVVQLDLSRTLVSEIRDKSLSFFPSLEYLDISHSSVNTIGSKGLHAFSNLKLVDFRECDIQEFPGDLFHGLNELTTIYATTFTLCCRDVLPDGFNADACVVPQDEISSCEDLLRSNLYRAFLWTIVFMSVSGNAGSLVFKLTFQRREMLKSGYNVFVTSLCVSDLFMGIYLAIIGAADEQYRGKYFWNEKFWKPSGMCLLAGFLSFLSNEVSSFMICLITLDRFIVLTFPFSPFRFKGRSAASALALAWTVGLFLAAVPLFPIMEHWKYYSQTGICIPLPITRTEFPGKLYSFGVMIIFNFVLFLIIALGQIVIYYGIRANSMAVSDKSAMSQNVIIARRLISVVVSDFLCWFPVGILGVMAFSGLPVPGEANVAVAIFVLPLNSAINPFLYTYNVLMEKHRLRKEAKLLQGRRSQATASEKWSTNASSIDDVRLC